MKTAILAVVLLALTGCANFDRDWTAAAAAPPKADSIEGAWTGDWRSDAGHGGGKLRGILLKQSESLHLARFEATFWGSMRGDYEITLTTHGDKVAGEEDLGFFAGGRYSYEGNITPQTFELRYRSERDHGIFTMSRPTTP